MFLGCPSWTRRAMGPQSQGISPQMPRDKPVQPYFISSLARWADEFGQKCRIGSPCDSLVRHFRPIGHWMVTTTGNTASEFVRDLCQPGIGTGGATGKILDVSLSLRWLQLVRGQDPPATSQVALIVRLGLFVRSAAADLEALRDYLGRCECPGTGRDAP